eukprot:1194136-Prorocentrum_minimum.AAC.3
MLFWRGLKGRSSVSSPCINPAPGTGTTSHSTASSDVALLFFAFLLTCSLLAIWFPDHPSLTEVFADPVRLSHVSLYVLADSSACTEVPATVAAQISRPTKLADPLEMRCVKGDGQSWQAFALLVSTCNVEYR